MEPKIKEKKNKQNKKSGKNWRKFWKLGSDEFNTQYFDITKYYYFFIEFFLFSFIENHTIII